MRSGPCPRSVLRAVGGLPVRLPRPTGRGSCGMRRGRGQACPRPFLRLRADCGLAPPAPPSLVWLCVAAWWRLGRRFVALPPLRAPPGGAVGRQPPAPIPQSHAVGQGSSRARSASLPHGGFCGVSVVRAAARRYPAGPPSRPKSRPASAPWAWSGGAPRPMKQSRPGAFSPSPPPVPLPLWGWGKRRVYALRRTRA